MTVKLRCYTNDDEFLIYRDLISSIFVTLAMFAFQRCFDKATV